MINMITRITASLLMVTVLAACGGGGGGSAPGDLGPLSDPGTLFATVIYTDNDAIQPNVVSNSQNATIVVRLTNAAGALAVDELVALSTNVGTLSPAGGSTRTGTDGTATFTLSVDNTVANQTPGTITLTVGDDSQALDPIPFSVQALDANMTASLQDASGAATTEIAIDRPATVVAINRKKNAELFCA